LPWFFSVPSDRSLNNILKWAMTASFSIFSNSTLCTPSFSQRR
jgi:hypothetical protein